MEGVALSSMVVVAGSHGADAVVSDTAIPSATSVDEADQIQIIKGDAATIFTIAAAAGADEEEGLNNNVEPTKKDAGDDGTTTTQCAAPVSGSRSPSSTHLKRRSSFSLTLFRAVFQSSFGRSDSMKRTSPKKKAIATAANGDDTPAAAGDSSPSWKALVDGVRPLRLRGQELEYYPPPPPLGHGADVYHDVLLPPPSPARSGFEFEEAGMTSRYVSAQDLHQMDSGGEEEEATPHAIDMQAEEFIAKFYAQFKSESSDGRAERASE